MNINGKNFIRITKEEFEALDAPMGAGVILVRDKQTGRVLVKRGGQLSFRLRDLFFRQQAGKPLVHKYGARVLEEVEVYYCDQLRPTEAVKAQVERALGDLLLVKDEKLEYRARERSIAQAVTVERQNKADVAKAWGISRQRVHQICQQAQYHQTQEAR